MEVCCLTFGSAALIFVFRKSSKQHFTAIISRDSQSSIMPSGFNDFVYLTQDPKSKKAKKSWLEWFSRLSL